MNRTKTISLLTLLIATELLASGYRFRCYAFCTDQTSVQDEYTEQRDHCRQYAQLKSEMASGNAEDKERKSQLISMFSDCMSRHGWTVPDGKDKSKDAAAGAAVVAAGAAGAAAAGPAAAGAGASASGAPAQDPATPASEQKAFLARASECNFARQNAAVSSNSAARAKACDLECERRLQGAPDAPRPAACPADVRANLSRGHESE